MKLTPKMLRGLIKEAIQSREPGSPLWSPEKTKRTRKTEAFGPYNVKGTNDQQERLPPRGKPRHPMMDDNFENARKELFSQALDSVVEEFSTTVHEYLHMEDASPEASDDLELELESVKEELREELLNVISSFLMKFADTDD